MSSSGRAVLRSRITPLIAAVVTLALLGVLLWNTPGGGAAGSTLEVSLSSANVGAHSDVSLVISIPGSTPFPDYLEIRFPPGWRFDDWGSTGTTPQPGEGEVIAVGQVVDPTFGTLPISIRSFGTNLGIARWLIETPRLCCISTTLSGSVLAGYTFVLDTALSFSTPVVLELAFFGALADGTPLLTNPTSTGLYEFSSTQVDFLGQATVATDVVQVGSPAPPTPTPAPTPTPPPDSDGDGVPDSSDACPDEAGSVFAGGCPPVGGVVELAVGSDDSMVEHRSERYEREVAALAIALAAVAGVS